MRMPPMAAFLLSLPGAFGLWAQSTQPGKLKLAVGSNPGNLVYLQVDLGLALGYFKQQGLDLQVEYFDGGVGAVRALVSGAAHFSANSIDHALRMDGSSPLAMVVSFTDLPLTTVLVRSELKPRVRSIKDLKGRRIGVTAIGAGTHVLAASVLHKAGLSLADVRIIPVGFGRSFVSAMRQGRIDAGMSTDPNTTELLMSGEASILLDMVSIEETRQVFGGPYQFTGILATQAMTRDRPQLVGAVVAAIVNTNRFIHSHSAAEIASRLPAAIVGDRYVYVKALERSRQGISKTGLVLADGVANNYQSQLIFGSASRQTKPDLSRFFVVHFVEEAWKQAPR